MKSYLTNTLAFTATLLIGCSNVSTIDNYEHNINSFIVEQELVPMESINSLFSYDVIALSDQHIALNTQNNKSYLLTTPDNCQGMHLAKKIIFLTKNEGIVQVNSDKIARVGNKHVECTITGIYKLHSVQLDELAHLYQQKQYYANRK
ncbi:DUF6491 family protein [Paraglaciecola sp.]|uniref:DUF6491 family protein n=1 Tax=Paraglaciecola sp. TaxID=1920173 RepID=UPI0030F3ACFE